MSGFIVGLIVTVHIAVCICLMISILLQSGKGGGLAGTFGAGSSQTLFGGRGAATFLSRSTTILAVVFFVTSLTLGLQASRSSGGRRSLIQEEARKRGQTQRGPETTAPGNQGAPGPSAPSGAPQPIQSPAPGTTNPAPAEVPPAPAPAGGTQAPATGGK
jgi:preprotein translocase subunit SecG